MRVRSLATLLPLLALQGCGSDAQPAAGDPFAAFDASSHDAGFDASSHDAPVEANILADAAEDAGDADAIVAADVADLEASTDADTNVAESTIRVLFVGNSYTYVNDLPGWVTRIALSSGRPPAIETDSITAGGATLQDHWSAPATVARVGDGTWDYVVLQGQSVEPLLDPATFHAYAQQLADTASQAGAGPVFFETWARQEGNEIYDYPFSGGTPSAMQQGLHDAYLLAAQNAGGVMAPAGDAWSVVLAQYPAMTLHAADGSHPTEAGTYLAACVFYATLTGQSPLGVQDRPASLSDADATALQTVAADLVPTP